MDETAGRLQAGSGACAELRRYSPPSTHQRKRQSGILSPPAPPGPRPSIITDINSHPPTTCHCAAAHLARRRYSWYYVRQRGDLYRGCLNARCIYSV